LYDEWEEKRRKGKMEIRFCDFQKILAEFGKSNHKQRFLSKDAILQAFRGHCNEEKILQKLISEGIIVNSVQYELHNKYKILSLSALLIDELSKIEPEADYFQKYINNWLLSKQFSFQNDDILEHCLLIATKCQYDCLVDVFLLSLIDDTELSRNKLLSFFSKEDFISRLFRLLDCTEHNKNELIQNNLRKVL
jgi:hypothetical protein